MKASSQGGKARAAAGRRRRRPADEARRAILDAAERRLLDVGPDAVRLSEIAADVGVSHPAILHHFGSREGLVAAVIQRALASLQHDLVSRLTSGDVDGAEILDRTLRTLGDQGQARLVAWLALTGRAGRRAGEGAQVIRAVAEAAHARRPRGADFEDTLFTIVLGGAALLGDAIAGPQIRASGGLADDRDAARRFRVWLARLLAQHLGAPPAAQPRPARTPRRRPGP
jgi:AcrR family transcriptional regulator